MTQQISVSHPIICQRSGLTMGRMELFLHEGHIAYLKTHSDAIYLHPFYNLSPVVLMNKFSDGLQQLHGEGYVASSSTKHRLQLLFSALAWSFECIKQDHPGLPSFPITVGSGERLLKLSKWFYLATSHRIELPEFHLAANNDNEGWENVKFWLDACFERRKDWETKSREFQMESLLRARTDAIKEIKSESYRRLDLNKIWNWIALQLEGEVHSTRILLWHDLFLSGDLEPENWTLDEVDDITEAVLCHCDIGNGIMHFIQSRLRGVRAVIQDFYGSFTLITRVDKNLLNDDGTPNRFKTGEAEMRTEKEVELLAGYEAKLDAMGELPPKPRRDQYASLGLFMKAEAQWNILNRIQQTRNKAEGKPLNNSGSAADSKNAPPF